MAGFDAGAEYVGVDAADGLVDVVGAAALAVRDSSEVPWGVGLGYAADKAR